MVLAAKRQFVSRCGESAELLPDFVTLAIESTVLRAHCNEQKGRVPACGGKWATENLLVGLHVHVIRIVIDTCGYIHVHILYMYMYVPYILDSRDHPWAYVQVP